MHEVTIVDGVPVEKHLCESCAREAGLVSQGPLPLEEILKQMTQPGVEGVEIEIHAVGPIEQSEVSDEPSSQSGTKAAGPVAGKPGMAGLPAMCPSCKLTFAAFRKSGKFGCASCYEAFEGRLTPIFDRAHEGATHHVGKVPKRAMKGVADKDDVQARELALLEARARAETINRVRHELAKAVASEQYEEAARLRDRLVELQRGQKPPAAPDQHSESDSQTRQDNEGNGQDKGDVGESA